MTRIAVCGVGNIGQVHIRNLLGIRGCRLSGIFDTNPPLLQKVSRECSTPQYASWQAILEDPALDAVVIATPAASHRDLCCEALAAGKHVFLEKPLANTLEDSLSIAEAAGKYPGQVVQVGFCERFNVAYLEAKRAAESGRLGNIRAIQSSRFAPYEYSDPTWELGVYDTAAHNLDLILWLKGAMPRSVIAQGSRVYEETPIQHFGVTTLNFDDGSMAVDTIAWLRKKRHPLAGCSESQMFIQGSLGSFRVNHDSRPAWFLNDDEFSYSDTVIIGGPEYYGCLRLQFDYFLAALYGEKEAAATVPEALAAEKVVLAAVASLKTGREVMLEA